MKIEASFSADTIVFILSFYVVIIDLNPDSTFRESRAFTLYNASIEILALSISKLYVKSNQFYYE
jgi:hypothetical protein